MTAVSTRVRPPYNPRVLSWLTAYDLPLETIQSPPDDGSYVPNPQLTNRLVITPGDTNRVRTENGVLPWTLVFSLWIREQWREYRGEGHERCTCYRCHDHEAFDAQLFEKYPPLTVEIAVVSEPPPESVRVAGTFVGPLEVVFVGSSYSSDIACETVSPATTRIRDLVSASWEHSDAETETQEVVAEGKPEPEVP